MTDETPMCSMCRRGFHLGCTALGCECTLTKRCRENAELTKARKPSGGDAA